MRKEGKEMPSYFVRPYKSSKQGWAWNKNLLISSYSVRFVYSFSKNQGLYIICEIGIGHAKMNKMWSLSSRGTTSLVRKVEGKQIITTECGLTEKPRYLVNVSVTRLQGLSFLHSRGLQFHAQRHILMYKIKSIDKLFKKIVPVSCFIEMYIYHVLDIFLN